MSKIRCLIVDDEPPAIELLEQYAGMINQLEIVATSHSGVKAFDLLKDTNVDLMFVDIRMPVLNGIDFIKTLKNPPAVILTTAYREYALDGYDLDIVDYLLKPISFDRFLKAIDRYRNRAKESKAMTEVISIKEIEHVFFNVNRTHHKVLLANILYVESLKDYSRIHLKDAKAIVVKGNIGTTLKHLDSNQFLRIHRSYAISLKHVQSYNQSEVEIHGTKLPIGNSYRKGLEGKMG